MESAMMEAVSMKARVLQVRDCDLLVCDCRNQLEVLVHTPDSCRFQVGDQICIRYNGIMTMSLPPQISATDISRGCCC